MPGAKTATAPTQGRPFPWFGPNCRRQELCRAIIPYEWQRFDSGEPMTVFLTALDVPRCGNCGGLVFTCETEEQINRAFREQIDTRRNGKSAASGAQGTAAEQKITS
jgi:hypothetical protein